MNSLKTLFVMAMLGAIAYGVYVSINNNPAPVATQGWQTPTVELPGVQTEAPAFTPGPANTGTIAAAQPNTAPGVGSAAPVVDVNVPSPPVAGLASNPSSTAADSTQATPAAAASSNSIGMPLPNYPSAATGAAPVDPAHMVPPPSAGIGQAPPAVATGTTPRAALPSVPQPRGSFSAFRADAQRKLDEGRLAEVLAELTPWRNAPQLSPEQQGQVQELLNQLAGTVVYSRQHLLGPPYTVRQGDTLETIGRQYNVSGRLLGKINGIGETQPLQPGQQLKVIRGPFDAEVDLQRYELVLTVQGRYAGRFPIGLGRDQQTVTGTHAVREKSTRPPQSVAGQVGPAGDALGSRWIGLGGNLGIHGTNSPQDIGRPGGNGWISLGNRDVEDVYDILSVGSRVVIRR